MKKVSKILIWATSAFLGLLVILNIILALFGRSIISSQIEKNLKLKAALDSVNIGIPLRLTINNLEIADLLRAKSISLSPSILGFMAGKIVLNDLKIVKPEITIVRDPQGKLNLPVLKQKGKQPPLLLAGLRVEDGRVVFIDRKISPQGHRVTLNKIDVNISKVALPPTSLHTDFDLSAELLDGRDNPAGRASAAGWVDFGPKDMKGKVELSDIDAASLSPYLNNILISKFLSARLNFNADLEAKNNDLIARCHGEFITGSPQQKKEDAPAGEDLIPNLLNLFSGTPGKIAFDFPIRTKLDNPRIDFISLKGFIGQAAVKNIAEQPPESVAEKVRDIASEFKEIGKGLKEIFKKKEE